MLKMSCPGLDMWYTPSTSTSARAGTVGLSGGDCCKRARMTAVTVVAGHIVDAPIPSSERLVCRLAGVSSLDRPYREEVGHRRCVRRYAAHCRSVVDPMNEEPVPTERSQIAGLESRPSIPPPTRPACAAAAAAGLRIASTPGRVARPAA